MKLKNSLIFVLLIQIFTCFPTPTPSVLPKSVASIQTLNKRNWLGNFVTSHYIATAAIGLGLFGISTVCMHYTLKHKQKIDEAEKKCRDPESSTVKSWLGWGAATIITLTATCLTMLGAMAGFFANSFESGNK